MLTLEIDEVSICVGVGKRVICDSVFKNLFKRLVTYKSVLAAVNPGFSVLGCAVVLNKQLMRIEAAWKGKSNVS